MIVFPAVDIQGGKAVRLRRGDFDDVTVFGDDPVTLARHWQDQGAEALHVIDLDAARTGELVNFEIVERIVKSLDILQEVGFKSDSICAVKHIPAQEGQYKDYPDDVHPSLLAALKKEGVYANLNLHVSRDFSRTGGKMAAADVPDFGKEVDLFDPELITLQKDYARDLLGIELQPETALDIVYQVENRQRVEAQGCDIGLFSH